MRSLGLGRGFGILFLFVALSPRAALAQSQNEHANRWFKSGVKQKNTERAIADYRKAIALDPAFKEALYNLALLYRKQKDYAQAKTLLEQARSAAGQSPAGDLAFNISYELALIYGRAENVEASADELRNAKKIAPDAKREALASLELARALHQQGRYREALAELDEGRRLDPGARANFDKLRSAVEEMLQIDELYQEAAKERASGNLENALVLLRQIQAQQPGFKNVPMEIADLTEQIEVDNQGKKAEQIYLQAQGYEADDRLERAIAAYQKLLEIAPAYQDAEFRLQRVQKRLEQKQRLLNVQPWLAAMQADTGHSILAERARRYYIDGRRAMDNGNYARALVAFEKARELNPGDAEVDYLLAEVRRHLHPTTTLLPFEQFADTGLAFGDSLTFFALDSITPAPSETRAAPILAATDSGVTIVPAITRLRDDDAKFLDQTNFTAGEEAVVDAGFNWRALFFSGAAVTLIFLYFKGVFPFSSVVNARAFLLLGNLQRAALIYEKQLQRDPEDMSVYPRLAGVYLRAGRTDDAALQIYERTLQLNLAKADREKLFMLVAQSKYAPNFNSPAADPMPNQTSQPQYRTSAG